MKNNKKCRKNMKFIWSSKKINTLILMNYLFLINHICRYLTLWSPNCWYFEKQYNYTNKLYIVCNWKKNMVCNLVQKRWSCLESLLIFLKMRKKEIVLVWKFKKKFVTCILIFFNIFFLGWNNKMKKTVIKTCSCFLEKAVWFINSPRLYPHWMFDAGKYDGLDIFILEKTKFVSYSE